jgi:hypothetical protein
MILDQRCGVGAHLSWPIGRVAFMANFMQPILFCGQSPQSRHDEP